MPRTHRSALTRRSAGSGERRLANADRRTEPTASHSQHSNSTNVRWWSITSDVRHTNTAWKTAVAAKSKTIHQ